LPWCRTAALRRGIDHPAHGHTVLHKRDVHGEIAAPLNELLRAVQRIDDQEGPGVDIMAAGLFLGHQRHIGKSLAKPRRDQRIGGFVGLGHGAVVGLRAHLEIIGTVDLHDAVTGQQRRTPQFHH
jgi:hypothetical protein